MKIKGKITTNKDGIKSIPDFTVSATIKGVVSYEEAKELLQRILETAGQKPLLKNQSRLTRWCRLIISITFTLTHLLLLIIIILSGYIIFDIVRDIKNTKDNVKKGFLDVELRLKKLEKKSV